MPELPVEVRRYLWFVVPPMLLVVAPAWWFEPVALASWGPVGAGVVGVLFGACVAAAWIRLIWYAPWLRP